MKTTLIAAAALALGSLAAAPGAHAGVIVHDSIAEFTSIIALQGQRTNGGGNNLVPVSAARSNIANMFDNDLSTAYSLGLGGTGAGGSVQFVISPVTNFITSGSIIELTFTGSNHVESAKVYLGTTLIGQIFNSQNPGGASATTANAAIATLSATNSGSTTTYALNVVSGDYNSLKLVDTSPYTLGGRNATADRDGFDIAELSITSTDRIAVPEPATLALFGAGLLGLGLARRRRSSRG